MTTGVFDDIMGGGQGETKPLSEDEKQARKMFPAMNEAREIESAGGYGLMAKQREAQVNEEQAQFELTMQTEQGAEIRQAAREEIDTLMRQARTYPSQRDDIAAKIEVIEDKFGNWLTVA